MYTSNLIQESCFWILRASMVGSKSLQTGKRLEFNTVTFVFQTKGEFQLVRVFSSSFALFSLFIQ